MNAKIAYYAIPNPTGTSAEAPALPRVIPNGVANTNDVIADIRNGIAATEARCRIALEAVIAVALEHVRRGEIVIAGGNLPERREWNPSDGNSFLTKVVDAGGETLFDGREILDEDLGPATGPDKVVVLGGILKDMIAESAGEEPSPGDVFTVSVWAKTARGTADEKTTNVVTFTAKVPA